MSARGRAARGEGGLPGRCQGGCKEVVAGQYSWPAQHTLMALTSPLLQIAAIMQQRFLGKHTPNCMRCGSRGVASRRPEERGEREKRGGGRWVEGYMALGLATRRRRQSLAAAAAPWPLAAFHFPFFAIPCNVHRLWGISIIVISNISNCTSAILAWRSLAVFWLARQRKLSWSWLLFLQRFLSP